jgi:hypothetical protein
MKIFTSITVFLEEQKKRDKERKFLIKRKKLIEKQRKIRETEKAKEAKDQANKNEDSEKKDENKDEVKEQPVPAELEETDVMMKSAESEEDEDIHGEGSQPN